MAARTTDETFDARRVLREGWKFCSTKADECATPESVHSVARDWHSAAVPCTVASALQSLGRWDLDDAEQRFDDSDWWFTLEFELSTTSGTDSTLEFKGLATLCDVWLNGQLLLSGTNMFVTHEVRASGLIAGRNVLHLAFRSLDAALRTRRPRPRWRVPMLENQQLRWFRTTLLGRTPGWSLPAAPVGPWRPIRLWHGRSAVESVSLRASLVGATGMLDFTARTALPPGSRAPVLCLRRAGVDVASAEVAHVGEQLESRLQVPDVECWWPHTHGRPALYDVVLQLGADTAGGPRELSLGRTGFRSVAARTGKQDGLALLINGEKLFCRGACWTPPDAVSLRATPQSLRQSVEQAVAAGFNMLRLSGTFIYEDEDFFMLCDELGIMIWQDFMFASMDYPADDEDFLASVRIEAEQQLRIWDHHPSVVVVCGNSEVSQQSAMWGRPREEWSPRLFSETLRDLAAEYCPRTCYWPSSASGGDFPHQPNTGTCSYYGVGAYLREPIDARDSGVTFATECLAFANIPEDSGLSMLPGGTSARAHNATWKRRSPRDLGAGWDFDDVRDHYVQTLFGIDPVQLRYTDHARFLVLGRQAVAEAMSAAFAEWRRPDSRCNGALVWFLRDMWPGAGWGIVDSAGEAKSPWYALRRNLQPQWIGITNEGLNGIAIHLANETAASCHVELQLTMYRDGRQVLGRSRQRVELQPRSGLSVNATSTLDGFQDLSHAYRFGPMSCDLIVASLTGDAGKPAASAFFLPRTDLHLQPRSDCTLQARAERLPDSEDYRLLVSCNGFARGVHIMAPGYVASDQYLNLEAGASSVITLLARSAGSRPPSGFVTAINVAMPTSIQVEV